jgi:hypothetical protein
MSRDTKDIRINKDFIIENQQIFILIKQSISRVSSTPANININQFE